MHVCLLHAWPSATPSYIGCCGGCRRRMRLQHSALCLTRRLPSLTRPTQKTPHVCLWMGSLFPTGESGTKHSCSCMELHLCVLACVQSSYQAQVCRQGSPFCVRLLVTVSLAAPTPSALPCGIPCCSPAVDCQPVSLFRVTCCRLAYSRWMTEWVNRLDPKASDELLILARGRCAASQPHTKHDAGRPHRS